MNESGIMQESYGENWSSPHSAHVDNVNIKRAVHAG